MADPVDRLPTEALNADEIADAVWLAARIAASEPPRPEPGPPPEPPPPPQAPPEPPEPPPEPPEPRVEHPPPARPEPVRPGGGHPEPPPVPLEPVPVPRRPRKPAAAPPIRAVPPSLPRGLAKALRPLNRLVRLKDRTELDEEETAVAAAETRVWLPVHRPSRGHAFEVVLVVDRGSSMVLWDRTTRAFRALLERQGAFSDVKTVSVDTDDPVVRAVETTPGTACEPAQLADPTGRRLVIVLSDGVGAAWRSGSMFRILTLWAKTCHVSFFHLLPGERWNWTGVRVAPRSLRGVLPGTANPIPVLELAPRHLRRWADLVSGTTGVRLPVLVPPRPDELTGDGTGDAGEALSPTERLDRFLATGTSPAIRLAGLLAAAPLTLRVMQAVHGTLMPQAHPAHLAEIHMGRLLHRVPANAGGEKPPVEYDFAPGLRRRLLATVSRADTARVQRVVEDVLGPHEPAVADLRGTLAAPDEATLPVVTSRTEPLLSVQRDVLRALSGPYARRANRLGDALERFQKSRNDPASRTIEDEIGSAASDLHPEPIKPPRGISAVTTTSSEPGTEIRSSGQQPAVWGGVPLRNVNFIGRGDLLRALHGELSKSTRTAVLPGALHGMGGIGKSQIAVEYVYRHAEEYDLIWWIPSENPSEIQASLVKLAKRLDLPVEQSVDTAVPAVLETLGSGEPYRRWLLVFDNADRPEDVREFWPRRGEGHILVTSRNPQWSEVAQAVEVDVFRRTESRELLQRRNRDLGDEDADRLATVLGDLPLAVEQAAAWRAETGMATDEYLQLFENKRTELLQSRPPADYDVAVEAAWNVSLDRLRDENRGALELLEVCAFFSPEPIPRAMFSGVRNVPTSEALEQTLGDPIQLGRAIREITRYSLAKIDHRSDTLQLHRLVQLVLRNKLTPEDQERVRHTAHLLLANRDPKQPDSVDYWTRYAELLPHIRAVDARNCTDRWVRRMAINAVNYLFAFGDPAGALEMAQDYAQYWTEKLGEKHPDTLVVSRWWGRMLRALGRFEEGRAVAERTLALMQETLGETHEETLLTMHGVASDLRAKGDFERARRMNEFAYLSALDRFGEDDPDTLAAANNYALSLRLVGEFAAARDLDERTAQRKQTVLGPDHRHTLLTLDNWSVDLRETGDYLRARAEQEDTVRRMRAQLGSRHPMTLSAIKNLAIAYRKAGLHRDKKALTLAMEATDGLVAKYGESHPDAMSATMDLSIEHRQDGNLAEARRLGEHVKGLYEATWGEKHPFSVAAATNLAVTLRLLGSAEQVEQARALDERALADMTEALGEDHPFTLVCATNYASDLAESGDHERAYQLDQATLERSERVLGPDHPSSLALLVNQALDLRRLGRTEEADSLQLNAVQRLRQVLGPEHPATADAQFNHRANCDIDPMQI
ncbi:FxSxx-COOH system tetratricopeptide repeat protein [Amycolatopsis australiensis]|uniref:Tetratricopeptide repeat-containing protein n=1 Tax=Amycolatopsis australiensis TaxID=546364 RepID=A0A1K1S468_9PSEU|nr:FxSxx-COOH system tetratricopeptide repeat protein [Amycolatopsis australiensis]SFW79240.1 Tetratricopeptide repeat-containing protein [Amycolatopsis australiensis]